MKKKKFYKNLWFWLLIASILFFVTNIVFSIIFRGSDGSNIFTAVSGWVSGVATIALGLIAVVQNRKYKEENDRFLSAQQKINSQLMQEQNDLSWRKIHYDIYNSYRRELLEYEKEFSKYSITEISAKTLANHDTIRAIGELSIFDKRIRNNLTRNIAYLIECNFYCEAKANLFDLFTKYLKILDAFYPLLQDAIKDINILGDLNGEYFKKAHELIDMEQKIVLSYLNINSEISSIIQKIYEKDISSAKDYIDKNITQQVECANCPWGFFSIPKAITHFCYCGIFTAPTSL